MKPLRFTPEALEETEEIAGYLADRNPEAALEFVDRLQAEVDLLRRMPELGHQHPDISVEGVRVVSFGRWSVIYSNLEHEILVHHLIGAGQDFRLLSFKQFD